MNRILFNFSHDLALARNCARYTPPPNVQIMERDLAELSNWLPEAEVSFNPYAPIWGWDLSFVESLRRKGYTELPSLEQLTKIRELSSRKTAVEALLQIKHACQQMYENMSILGESWFASSIQEFESCMQNLFYIKKVSVVLKEPLSGSGRGLRFVKDSISEAQRNWALRCIREQGGVVVEPLYDKVQDFAMEFVVTPNGVEYLGLSVFDTNSNNVYSGNSIASQESLLGRISKYVPQSDIESLNSKVIEQLEKMFVGYYVGPLGVDMMVVKNFDKYSIHPCVEINVRRTMGEFSLHLYSLLSPKAMGFFCIVYNKSSEVLNDFVTSVPQAQYDNNGLLVSGTKLLTPVKSDTHYVAILEIV